MSYVKKIIEIEKNPKVACDCKKKSKTFTQCQQFQQNQKRYSKVSLNLPKYDISFAWK